MSDHGSLSGWPPPGGAGTGNKDRVNPALGRAVLRSRVRTITDGSVDLEPDSEGLVMAAVVDGTAYAQTADARGLGPCLRWAFSNGADRLRLIAEAPVAPDLARRARLLDADITVWSAEGPGVEPAVPGPVIEPPAVSVDHLPFASVISEAGARPIDDHGLLVAEVAGLEVARVVIDERGSGRGPDGGPGNPADTEPDTVPRLAVGVGQADRELQQYLHRHLDDGANLRRAIAAVVRHRRPGQAAHPLTRLARQRWLRSVLLDDPSQIGLSDLEPVPPLRPRDAVSGDEPAAAASAAAVVICSVGVDLDLLPEAVDYRARVAPDAELVVVVPERDRRLATESLAPVVSRLRVESIPPPWEVSAAI